MRRFTVVGAPRTKKNHGWRTKQGFQMPSKAWKRWLETAQVVPAVQTDWMTLQPVNCRAVFYRDANRGDAVGYYQGLADLLEWYEIVKDDGLIVSWDGSRLLKDKDNPRVEVELTEV